MRFSVGGWLANRLVSVLPTNGSTMNMLFIAGLGLRMGMRPAGLR